VKDWFLFVGVVVLVGILLVILIIGESVMALVPTPQLVVDEERPSGRTVKKYVHNCCITKKMVC
jgi:hypothetical protein